MEVTGEQLKPLEGRPYLKMYQARCADQPVKVKPKPRKKGRKKGKRAPAR